MASTLKSFAKYIIRPLQTNHPLGVSKEDYSRPCLGPRPVVFLYPATDQPQKFEVVEVGENTHEITFDSMGVADEDDRVFAHPQFPPEEYVIHYRKMHQASTIMKKGTNLAWSHPLERQTGQQVHLFPLEESSGIVPDYQLIRFEYVSEDRQND